ncbi:ethanolamine kinase [Capronia epimyces CBS 606.96]|uniref:ethanolamine kinase n=1 Tax=Capronia epimyces CBS 606.96 TaxID=1182542 RepID=W9XXM6_9EURO|nr:ethanolamine kinase [Capronia epimyces CBS 606.96]EXJ85302.1 ethanolamine kinase [Capronia epimyces CBS 606.96]
MGAPNGTANGDSPQLPYIDLVFDNKHVDDSARALVYRIQPKWREAPGTLEIVRFTEGITNTLLKVSKYLPGQSHADVDRESILLRAYGNNTEILIDRDREARSHALLAERGLAPPLLARFKNGLLYRYIIGQVCTPGDLITEPVWRAVAKRLGEWHARLPVDSASQANDVDSTNGTTPNSPRPYSDPEGRKPVQNIWSVMQKWTDALPCDTSKQRARKESLQKELSQSITDLDNGRGPGSHGLIFGHCDLLSANVIMLPRDSASSNLDGGIKVSFIDYEYATPCPAAFDIANHFAEWGGYDCDYNMLPTKSIRRHFLQDYLESYKAHSDNPISDDMLDVLVDEVDRYRGMPGLYWGIWALIQATISQIDFDYASYAEVRLGEYFAWRAEQNGKRVQEGTEMPLRERRWAEN